MFGIIGIGVMFVIVTGGIDLSIGSTIGLIGASLVLLLRLNPIDSLKPLLEDDKAKVVWFFWAIVIVMVLASVAWLVYSALQSNFRFKKILFPLIFLAFFHLECDRPANCELGAAKHDSNPMDFLFAFFDIHSHRITAWHFDYAFRIATVCRYAWRTTLLSRFNPMVDQRFDSRPFFDI